MAIDATQARAKYTNTLIDAYRQVPQVMGFLRSKFTAVTSGTKYVSIDVERSGEQVAIDVERGSEGNRNKFALNMNKVFLPPYYRENFNATDLDLYDRAFASPLIDVGIFSQLVQVTAIRMKQLQDKIDRAIELQCSSVYEFGTINLSNGDTIDYKRKAGSMVDKTAGNYWDQTTVSPYNDIENGCKFLRSVGKMAGGTVDVYMGSTAFQLFLDNAFVIQRNDIKMWKLDDLVTPTRNAAGGTYHGTISCGSYTAHIWTYPEFYDAPGTGTSTEYLNPKKIIITPIVPRFTLAYAAVPRLLMGAAPSALLGKTTDMQGQYVIGDYTDSRLDAHIFDIKSAPLALPVAVDQIYTLQVAA